MKLNNKGLSLVEVVVYMIVSIIIIGYIFNTLSNITHSFHQEKKKSVLQMNGQDAISLLARDIATTGFKHFLDTSKIEDSILYRKRIFKGTYLRTVLKEFPNGKESSEYDASFLIYPGTYFDTLEVLRAKMLHAHKLDTVQRITYVPDNGELKRESRSYLRFIDDIDFDSDTNSKYEICHFPDDASDNPHTLTVSRSAIITHIDHHDDYLGECVDEYIGPSDVDENKWDYDNSNDVYILNNIVALKFNFSEDFETWYNDPPDPELVNYIRIMLLLRSEREGNVVNNPTFNLGIGEDELPLTYTVPEGNKYFYRLYERTVEVPSNGRL